MLTLGSLFDGIGGFPLAAQRVGIKPIWASEIEKFPIWVTKERFPEMIHVGDITKLDGAELPPVDVITGGSPCQDLSVAQGRRDGLAGSRSGLFYEMVRVIKEMRDAEKKTGPDNSVCSPKMDMLGKRAWKLLKRNAAGRGFPHRLTGVHKHWLRYRFCPST